MKGLLLIFCLFLSSCAIYRQNFDCPPSSGEACRSVTEIESQVVEAEEGPDLFLPHPSDSPCRSPSRRIWVPNRCGKGRYVPLDLEGAC